MSLGEEAAEVFKYLGPKEVQRIGQAMSKLKSITKDRIEEVLGEFEEAAGQQTSIARTPAPTSARC
jgi:flagellar motor switch protein FliG